MISWTLLTANTVFKAFLDPLSLLTLLVLQIKEWIDLDGNSVVPRCDSLDVPLYEIIVMHFVKIVEIVNDKERDENR